MPRPLLALLGLLMLILTGCGMDNDPQARDAQEEKDFHLQDGRTVHCLWITLNYGGPSCDWGHAK